MNENKPKKIASAAPKFEKQIEEILGKSFDVVIYRFKTTQDEAVIVHIDGMASKDLIDRDIIKPLKRKDFDGDINLTLNVPFESETSFEKVIQAILDGNAIVYYAKAVYVADLKQFDKRSVEMPQGEEVNRGPKEGFTESILTNMSMLRRKLKTTNLIYEKLVLGKQSSTIIAIAYLDNIVNRGVLDKVREKLQKIDTDAILESGYLEQYIEEHPLCIISGIGLTQKPDVVAAKIIEGRVAILCDGTPHTLLIPELFLENVHTAEEFYDRTIKANITRFLKMLALTLNVLLPGVSVAILTYHQEMVPFTFLISFIQATQGTPLTEAAELFFLAIMFELLKEAGLRTPKVIGASITIVGGLILGETAVSAGIVGAPSVIIIAISSVTSLAVTNLSEFNTVYRFLFLMLGSIMGIIGIAVGFIIMLTQLISTESFGIPILASFSKEELKDSVIRFPLKSMKYRPESIAKNNIVRNNFTQDGKGN
ncbi:MAG: spore germination protein [Clostridia bacterium]|nr:spore germination protein [Clostridia bacterium]